MLLYIVEAKKGCKKKSLNILSLAADLLKKVSRILILHIILETVFKIINGINEITFPNYFEGAICV